MPSINLAALPEWHDLRNTKLGMIGARYQANKTGPYTDVTPAFGIAKVTYNQLASVWTYNTNWEATTDHNAWDEERTDTIGQNGNEGSHYEGINTGDV